MPYCAAVALARGGVALHDFEDGPVDAVVGTLLPRVRMVVDPSLPDTLEQQAWPRYPCPDVAAVGRGGVKSRSGRYGEE